jgi:FkbH-like protein
MTATVTTPSEELAALHRSGRLADEYPRVRSLLADLSGTELVRAGRLLSRLDPTAVLAKHPEQPTLTVAVTGHGTLSELVAPLTAELARHGLLVRPFVADFDSYVADLADPDSALYATGPDLTLCVLDPYVVFDEVPMPWAPADVARVLDEKVALVARLADSHARRAGEATLVLNTLPLPARFAAQLVDHRSRAQLGAVWREGNARLLRLVEDRPALTVLDLDPLLAAGDAAEDPRLSVYTHTHLSPALFSSYAREIGHLARHLTGHTKKVLVLDLDGTVWGGVLGDDGVDGVEVSGTYRGEAFRAFQRVARQLGAQGVLLAAVSKNDAAPVRAALRDHPEMTLRQGDFVRVVANWRPKHDNLVELARALNLGLDSIVFVDDSPYECGLVRAELPEVTVVPVDDEPAHHVEKLLRDGWFTTRELTVEDRRRGATYQEEQARQDFLDTADSLTDYLRGLGIRVRFWPVEPHEVPRLSQLTLRTNQFNLTTRRLQPAEVAELVRDTDNDVLAIRVSDRFGDSELVGAVLLRRAGDVVRIENFLLSCRVFSRGIEQACLSSVLRDAKAAGAVAVEGAYRPTSRTCPRRRSTSSW